MTLIQRQTVFSLVLVSNNGWMNGPGGVYVDFLPLDFNVLSMTFFIFFEWLSMTFIIFGFEVEKDNFVLTTSL
jgi:hypothetical protein